WWRIALCPQPAPGDSQRTVMPQAGGSLGEGYMIRMLQVESKLGRRGVTRRRINLQTAQYDFLQPWRYGHIATTRSNGIPPQPPTPVRQHLRLTERPFTGCQDIDNDAQSEQVAARVAAVAEDLLWSNKSTGSKRTFRLFAH